MLHIDHIQITVRDMKAAEPFYDLLMPILGYDLNNKISAVIEGVDSCHGIHKAYRRR